LHKIEVNLREEPPAAHKPASQAVSAQAGAKNAAPSAKAPKAAGGKSKLFEFRNPLKSSSSTQNNSKANS